MNPNSHRLFSSALYVLFVFSVGYSCSPLQADEHFPTTEQPFDAAPFARAHHSKDNKKYTLRWNEPRSIRRVEIEFAADASLPNPKNIHLQYWHREWNGLADLPVSEINPAAEGWQKVDDWTNGQWKNADVRVRKNANTLSFTFAPTNETEFPQLNGPGVTWRKTLKIRLLGDQPLPPIKGVKVFTDSTIRPMAVRILLDSSAHKAFTFDDEEELRFEAYNGKILAVRPLTDSSAVVQGDRVTIPRGMRGGVLLHLAASVDSLDASPDRTVITVRSSKRPFSFAPQDLLLGRRILIDDLGVLITKHDDSVTIGGWRKALRELGRKTVYDRVSTSAEQTLANAWNDMPLKRPLYFVHGLPGNRNVFRHDPNGDLAVSGTPQRFKWLPSPKDSDRKLWQGDYLELGFGFPVNQQCGRELREGYLPQLRSWWQEGSLHYEQTAILGKLNGNLESNALDDPTLLLMRIRIVNTSATESADAKLLLSSNASTGGERLELDGDRIFAREKSGERHFRYLLQSADRGKTASAGNNLRWSLELKPGESHELFLAVPSITLTEDREIAALAKRQFDAECRTICNFWRNFTSRSTQILTPEPWLNGFYKAHARHLEVNSLCDVDPKFSRRYVVVGSFHYCVYPNESAMMIADLDRRGLHKTAEDSLQSMIDFQGTKALPGNFKSQDGVYYGANQLETGNYNKNHGYILWCLAEHWNYTRDRAWLERVSPSIIAACEWIIRERKATMKLNPDGTRPPEYGFLPAGGLEDVQDFWYWQATNTATVWGFDAAAKALADLGHPEAKRLQAEAKAYHDDVMQGLAESRILSPVVRLRDGTYVPKYPSHQQLRGRANGWVRETLEGSMLLPAYGLIQANAPETAWIVKDYEDNLYISDQYGYSIPTFEQFWFSRGGFSMQANLLDGPLAYLYRDDIKHYLRAFFNGFASAFYPEIKMLNEHSKPELGYPVGDHFKSSDEAQVTYWLRLMFVREAGDDLYLGQAIPRYWLDDGNKIGIQNAATYYGPMSLTYQSSLRRNGKITVEFDPPRRNPPQKIYLRLRHPEEKPMKNVTINGSPYDKIDIQKEWIVLPGDLTGHQTITVSY